MQKFSKTELEEQAAAFMKAHQVRTFLATEDGNFFHPKDAGLAADHNNKHVKGEVFEFVAPDEKEAAEKEAAEKAAAEKEAAEKEAAAKEAAEKEAAEKEAAEKAAAEKVIDIDPANAVVEPAGNGKSKGTKKIKDVA